MAGRLPGPLCGHGQKNQLVALDTDGLNSLAPVPKRASTPEPAGHKEGAALDQQEIEARLLYLKVQLRQFSRWLREKGVDWAKDKAVDKGLDWLKDKGIDVLKSLIGKPAAVATFLTDWVRKIVETNQKMSEEWVKHQDPGAKRIEVKGGAPTAAAIEKLLKDGGTVWNGEGGMFWIKYPDYKPHSRSTATWTVNPTNPSNPHYDNGNNKQDDRPDDFGTLVFAVATIDVMFEKAWDLATEEDEESHSRKKSWAAKAVSEMAKKYAADKLDEMLKKAAAKKVHHPSPKPMSSVTEPGAPPTAKPAGPGVITPKTSINQCDSVRDGSSCIKQKSHPGPHQDYAGNTW